MCSNFFTYEKFVMGFFDGFLKKTLRDWEIIANKERAAELERLESISPPEMKFDDFIAFIPDPDDDYFNTN